MFGSFLVFELGLQPLQDVRRCAVCVRDAVWFYFGLLPNSTTSPPGVLVKILSPPACLWIRMYVTLCVYW